MTRSWKGSGRAKSSLLLNCSRAQQFHRASTNAAAQVSRVPGITPLLFFCTSQDPLRGSHLRFRPAFPKPVVRDAVPRGWQQPYLGSQVRAVLGAGLAVSVLHDVHCGLVPPVQHHHCQDVPHLVARAEVVQLACGGEQGHGVQLLNLATAHAVQSVCRRAPPHPALEGRQGKFFNVPLFYSVWEQRIGNTVSLFSPRKFRTHSKDCDTVGS